MVTLAGCNAYDRARYESFLDGAADSTVRVDGSADAPADRSPPIDAPDVTTDTMSVDGASDALDVGEVFTDVTMSNDVTTTDAVDAPIDTGTDACVATTEICNGRDDDCDGMIDEGFDLMTDPAHCGSCATTCLLAHSAPVCTNGACVPTCVAGFADCDGVVANGCEANLTAATTCGRCGHTCTGTATCDAAGACSDEYVQAIEVAGDASCALRRNGTVWCWGNNIEGVLGNGTTVSTTSPVQVTGLTSVTALTGSDHHRCALRSDRSVWCWGSNENGALGDGTNVMRTSPVRVTGLNDAVAIEAGRHHVCALRATGALVCWGRNGDNEIADGTTTSRYTPTLVTGAVGAIELGSYGYQNCFVHAAGDAMCWGRNVDGEVGIGSMLTPIPSPTAVMNLTDAVEVDGGYTFSCARHRTGRVVCWGDNTYGEAGDGTRDMLIRRIAPGADVATITDATMISAGNSHVCARRMGGTAMCWGANGHGQLGDGTLSVRTMPVTVMGLSNITQINLGDSHTCALLADGTVRCWGENSSGQLGDGTGTVRTAPTRVIGLP